MNENFIEEDMKLSVKRGAHFMDENYPNWASMINFDTFEMDNCHQCIVGQAIGDYGIAISQACGQKAYSHEATAWAVEYGFDVAPEAYEIHDGYEAYRELETLWTDQVRERLG